MRTVYHFPLCPFSRKLRLALREKELPFELTEERFWERRKGFAHLNPAMQVPVLVEAGGNCFPDSIAICEYLEEKYTDKPLISGSLEQKAEIRRLISWFDIKMAQEVTLPLVQEKVICFFQKQGAPRSEVLRAAKKNLRYHLAYLEFLTSEAHLLVGENITLADLAAAAHLSSLDFLGEVPWAEYPHVKEWYALLKSRPSFRPLLADYITGFKPPVHYTNPDF